MTRRLILSVITLCTVIACTTDAYESGDGTYSYMRADFAESYTNSQTQFFAADTDDDRHVEFQQVMAREWATTPDSVYRTLVYYSAQPDANSKCRLFSVVPVNVLRYKPVEEVKEMHTDPLDWNSIWTSSNGKYLNLGLTIMTGYTQEGEIVLQNLGLVCDEVRTLADEKREFVMRLYHAQNESPQYYSSDVYASIPLNDFHAGDVLTITANTYDGEQTRQYTVTP